MMIIQMRYEGVWFRSQKILKYCTPDELYTLWESNYLHSMLPQGAKSMYNHPELYISY